MIAVPDCTNISSIASGLQLIHASCVYIVSKSALFRDGLLKLALETRFGQIYTLHHYSPAHQGFCEESS
jgi:hypothetical protein